MAGQPLKLGFWDASLNICQIWLLGDVWPVKCNVLPCSQADAALQFCSLDEARISYPAPLRAVIGSYLQRAVVVRLAGFNPTSSVSLVEINDRETRYTM